MVEENVLPGATSMETIEEYVAEVRRLLKDFETLTEEIITYYVQTCTRCLLCRTVCPVYRATKEIIYSPEYRLATALRIIRGSKPSPDDVKSLFSCLLCGLCSMACPYGIGVWLAVLMARYKLASRGLAPRGLKEVAENCIRYGHSFTSEPHKAVSWARDANLRLDEPGDYLYVPSPLENLRFPEKTVVKAALMRRLGISFTVSSRIVDIGGNAGMDASRIDIGLAMLWRAYEEAERLGARGIVVSECGSDVKLAFVVLPAVARALGLKTEKLLHLYDILAQRIQRLHISNATSIFFTSCNFCRFTDKCPVRLLGLPGPRDKRPYTSCCGGGGGYTINLEPWARRIRRSIASARLASIRASEIVVPCIKCYTTLREAALLSKAKKRIVLVSEKVYEAIVGTP
ncbi:MAG: (Fe-S)-binding protein [Pyrodictiaceae archaeon]